jgi:molecular chaperone DnaK (HSP70)
MLSAATKTDIDCFDLADGCDINIELSRARFENLCAEVFQRCRAPIELVL